MGWSSAVRQAAAEEYGRRNWARIAARRRTGQSFLLIGLGLFGLTLLARAGYRAAAPHVHPTTPPPVDWTHLLLVAGWVVGVVVLGRLAVRLGGRYRIPRRRVRVFRRY